MQPSVSGSLSEKGDLSEFEIIGLQVEQPSLKNHLEVRTPFSGHPQAVDFITNPLDDDQGSFRCLTMLLFCAVFSLKILM